MISKSDAIMSIFTVSLIFGTLMFILGHDIAITKCKANQEVITKMTCWTKTMPHLTVMHQLKCPMELKNEKRR